jgi:predicted transcriptional regulator
MVKTKAKEIMEMTGRSERTVRKYFSQPRDDTNKQQ